MNTNFGAKLIHLKNGRVDLKFPRAKMKKFKKDIRVSAGEMAYILKFDKNGACFDVYKIYMTERLQDNTRRKERFPEALNILRGNTQSKAIERLMAFLHLEFV